MEVWKDIPEYKGYYQASDYGRIRSIDRHVRKNGKVRFYKGRILKAKARERERDKYLVVTLCKSGHEKQKKVHRLVLEAFVGECPPGFEGCHDDGNIYNNIPKNLRWDTRSNNMQDKIKHGTAQRGEQSTNVLLKESDVLKMRNLYRGGQVTLKKLGEMFGISESGTKSIIYRNSWKHI